jgi:hypothetical protein
MAKQAVVGIVSAMLAQALVIPAAWAKEDPARENHVVVAATGSAAPGGGTFFRFLTLALNEHGEVAFDAFLLGSSREGIFLWERGTSSAIARAGNPDPASGDFALVGSPAIDSRGSVVFNGDAGLFRAHGTRIDAIMQDGAPAPGGGNFVGPPASHSSNSHGAVAFLTGIASEESTTGIFLRSGHRTAAIARDNNPSPLGGTFIFFGDPVVGRGGQVAFFAGMTGGPGDFGIFRGDGEGETRTIFGASQQAPGGATFMDFGDPVINERGQVAAVALLENGSGQAGLFRGDGRETSVIALDGASAPAGGKFTASFFQPLRMNDRGQIAFNARLTAGTSNGGIFRSDGSTMTAVALLGTTAPGTAGTFSSFGDIRISEDGTIAFIGTLAIGVGGVDVTNNRGIWFGTSERDLRLLVRTGDVIAGRTLTSLPSTFGQFDMNERSVVWAGGFPERSAAIIISTIDEKR